MTQKPSLSVRDSFGVRHYANPHKWHTGLYNQFCEPKTSKFRCNGEFGLVTCITCICALRGSLSFRVMSMSDYPDETCMCIWDGTFIHGVRHVYRADYTTLATWCGVSAYSFASDGGSYVETHTFVTCIACLASEPRSTP